MNRRNFLTTASVAALGTGVSGCALFGNKADRIALAAGIARSAAEIGTVAAIRADPSKRYSIALALEVLERILGDENYSSAQLAAALQSTGEEIFRGETGALIMGAVVSVFELATSAQYVLESAKAVRVVGQAIAEGMRAGLAVTAARKWKPSIAPTYAIHPIDRYKI